MSALIWFAFILFWLFYEFMLILTNFFFFISHSVQFGFIQIRSSKPKWWKKRERNDLTIETLSSRQFHLATFQTKRALNQLRSRTDNKCNFFLCSSSFLSKSSNDSLKSMKCVAFNACHVSFSLPLSFQ